MSDKHRTGTQWAGGDRLGGMGGGMASCGAAGYWVRRQRTYCVGCPGRCWGLEGA